MGTCRHSWEFQIGRGYDPNNENKSYKCSLCGATTTDEEVVENVLNKIKEMKDGEEGTIEGLLSDADYGYTELSHICMLVCFKARGANLMLDSEEASGAFLQPDTVFKKRAKKRISIKRIGNKGANGYKSGDIEMESIGISIFDKVKIKYSLTFCCDDKMQTKKSFDHNESHVVDKDELAALNAWCDKIAETCTKHDMTNRALVLPEHYGHTIVIIDGEGYLLKSKDKILKEIDTLINIAPIRKEINEKKKKFIGVGVKVDNDAGTMPSSSGATSPVAEWIDKIKIILTKPL